MIGKADVEFGNIRSEVSCELELEVFRSQGDVHDLNCLRELPILARWEVGRGAVKRG